LDAVLQAAEMKMRDETTLSKARSEAMGLLARAKPDMLAKLFAAIPEPAFVWLRSPQIGLVMVQGRIGGEGGPFNLGEMTVTRCVLRLDAGAVGHATVQGRDKTHATQAALADALWQADPAGIEVAFLGPLRAAEVARRSERAARAAATRVEFFTLVRGEDK
jgi:alpha-D-ribose 1-methylphosphonate 5-triphosphate synthase subunit PhnG